MLIYSLDLLLRRTVVPLQAKKKKTSERQGTEYLDLLVTWQKYCTIKPTSKSVLMTYGELQVDLADNLEDLTYSGKALLIYFYP
jgi:hypothetical protein